GAGRDDAVSTAKEPAIESVPRCSQLVTLRRGAGDEPAGSARAGGREHPQAKQVPGMDHIGMEPIDELPQPPKEAEIEESLPSELANLDAAGTHSVRGSEKGS